MHHGSLDGEPPQRAQLFDWINASWTTQAIRSACVLQLPDWLARGASSADEAAAGLGCDAPALARLLRALATLGLCAEDDAGRHALTATGALLCEDHPQSLRAWALMAGGPQWQRWGELDQSVRTGCSHRRRHGGSDGFDDLATDPAAAEQFYRAMVEMTRSIAGAVVQAMNATGARCVVDVGGGRGELLAQVLAAHPSLRGVLFDLPQGLAGADAVLAQHGVAARCRCMAGSFFETVPEGDVQLLKSVLHNWDDARAVQILARCRDALAPVGRVLIVERLVADRIGRTPQDRDVARSDLNMLVALSGRERRRSEFAALCAAAGLALTGEAHATGAWHVLQARAA
ncbi:methyltransferase [Aquabacterium humicola]|uniref:methyltransferase n=1 Tax=Aquabacterium humicola TaxID=3237377 RepID=UPI002542FAB8|nr:methyltransferase [Rubrivivax pictus]